MVAKFYRVRVTIPADTGLPKDDVMNNWSFQNETTALLLQDSSAIDNRLSAFYSAMGSAFSSYLNLAGARMQIVDMTDPYPRIPFYDEPLTITGASTTGDDLPQDVAMCLSFKKTPSSGDNARRTRGRVYIGPLQVSAGDQFQATSTLVDALANAANTHILLENDDLEWAIYSQYTHHDVPVGERLYDSEGNLQYPENSLLLAQSFVPVGVIWVDNEWDTQRRRGLDATYRKTLP